MPLVVNIIAGTVNLTFELILLLLSSLFFHVVNINVFMKCTCILNMSAVDSGCAALFMV